MPSHFCFSCGFKNVYDGLKPSLCPSCGKSVEAKPIVRPVRSAGRREEPEEIYIPEEPEFNLDPRSIRVEKAAKTLVFEDLVKDHVAIPSRGSAPGVSDPKMQAELQQMKQEAIDIALGKAKPKAEMGTNPFLQKAAGSAKPVTRLSR